MKDDTDPAFEKANATRMAICLNLAACRNKMKKWREVVPILTPVIKLNPSNHKALFRRAEAYYGLRLYQECMQDAKQAFDIHPSEQVI